LAREIIKSFIIVDGYYVDSHRYWAEQLVDHHSFEVQIFSLPPRHWKWQMESGAISLARQINNREMNIDTVLCTDMLNLPLLKSLVIQDAKYLLYMHENQLTYPRSPFDPDTKSKRDLRYAFINFTSCLVADRIVFNSHFHRQDFLSALPKFLKKFPKNKLALHIDDIEAKSEVIPIGFDHKKYQVLDHQNNESELPFILWNHRWEYDKNPQEFLQVMNVLTQEDFEFRLILLGKGADTLDLSPFPLLSEKVFHQGFADSFDRYKALLYKSHIIVSTSIHEFFGISVMEALACDCYPVLPNRLSYPELIPDHKQSEVLYDNLEIGFYTKMKEVLNSEKWKNPSPLFKDYIFQNFDTNKTLDKYNF